MSRKKAGFTQSSLVETVGVTSPVITELETGKYRSSKHLIKIARALNVDPFWLESGENPTNDVFDNLNNFEKELVRYYRLLSDKDKK